MVHLAVILIWRFDGIDLNCQIKITANTISYLENTDIIYNYNLKNTEHESIYRLTFIIFISCTYHCFRANRV